MSTGMVVSDRPIASERENAETTPTDRFTEDLLRATRIFVAVAADSHSNEEDGLSLQQYRALALLASQEAQRPADLARSLGVTPSTTTALCDRLAQKRLISRRRRGTDRRSVYLVVSPRGHRQLEKIAMRRAMLLEKILVRVPMANQAQLAEALPAFVKAAGEVGVDEWSIRGL